MPLIAALMVFVASMIFCLACGHTILLSMVIGWIAFAAAGHKNGFEYKELNRMAAGGIKESIIVVEIMFLIGFITAIWRSAGTIAFFVYYGIQILTPSMFIITAFLLCCFLSYILGTSFGVAGTLGVIIMAIARSGGVNEAVAAGAIMSGVYFGDRSSPVSSSAILVAAITKTDLYDNIKMMFKTAALPLVLITAGYAALSLFNPLHSIDKTVVNALESSFDLNLWTIIPALFMLILPLLKVDIVWVFVASVLSGGVITLVVQKMPAGEFIKCCISGFEAQSSALGNILDGGGLMSMVEVCGVVMISSAYSGIFNGTDMLKSLQDKISALCEKLGRFGAMLVVSTAITGVFCNQTIASIMSRDLMEKPYAKGGASNTELAMDIENSSIIICGMVPWAISCTVPLKMLGAGYSALVYAFLLYVIPLCYIFTKKMYFGKDEKKAV